MVLLIMALCWQVGLVAVSSVWLNSAATAASHAAAAGEDAGPAARGKVPTGFRSRVTVSPDVGPVSQGQVTVRVAVPLITLRLGAPFVLTVRRTVVTEP